METIILPLSEYPKIIITGLLITPECLDKDSIQKKYQVGYNKKELDCKTNEKQKIGFK